MGLMKSMFGKCIHSDEQVWMIDGYRMDRIELKNFLIRDQFTEPGYAHGSSRVYYWQHRSADKCTIKVRATVTDSNARAHELLKRFIAIIPYPDAITKLGDSRTETEWFKQTGAESVYTFNHGTGADMVFLVWGNIFFHIESIGEEDHSIFTLLEDLGDIFVKKKKDQESEPEFVLDSDNTALKYGQEISLHRRDRNKLRDYYAYLYVAGPKEHVALYRKNGVITLQVNTPDADAGNEDIAPYVQLIGLCPNGQFIEGEKLEFTVEKGG